MGKILCSTGALIGRPNGRNYHLLSECIGMLQCDGYELMFYDTWYPEADDLIQYLKKIKLPIYAWHCEKTIGQDIALGTEDALKRAREQFRINCELASALHVPKMVMHVWDGQASDQNFDRHLAALEWLYGIAKGYGINLLAENVVCSKMDPITRLHQIADAYPDASFTWDTKMAAFHGQMESVDRLMNQRLWKEKRILHLHVNDYAGGYKDWNHLKTLHIGQGRIDLAAFFSFLRAAGYTADFTLEGTSFDRNGTIHFDEINKDVLWIRQHWL